MEEILGIGMGSKSIKKSVKDSAALENRIVPEDFVRSEEVQEFLDSREPVYVTIPEDLSLRMYDLVRAIAAGHSDPLLIIEANNLHKEIRRVLGEEDE